jgi:hypothetical protein
MAGPQTKLNVFGIVWEAAGFLVRRPVTVLVWALCYGAWAYAGLASPTFEGLYAGLMLIGTFLGLSYFHLTVMRTAAYRSVLRPGARPPYLGFGHDEARQIWTAMSPVRSIPLGAIFAACLGLLGILMVSACTVYFIRGSARIVFPAAGVALLLLWSWIHVRASLTQAALFRETDEPAEFAWKVARGQVLALQALYLVASAACILVAVAVVLLSGLLLGDPTLARPWAEVFSTDPLAPGRIGLAAMVGLILATRLAIYNRAVALAFASLAPDPAPKLEAA